MAVKIFLFYLKELLIQSSEMSETDYNFINLTVLLIFTVIILCIDYYIASRAQRIIIMSNKVLKTSCWMSLQNYVNTSII